jgi:hypothetical protein
MVHPGRRNVSIRRMRFACWITMARDTHSEYVILFHGNNRYANAPKCHVIRGLPLLLTISPFRFCKPLCSLFLCKISK